MKGFASNKFDNYTGTGGNVYEDFFPGPPMPKLPMPKPPMPKLPPTPKPPMPKLPPTPKPKPAPTAEVEQPNINVNVNSGYGVHHVTHSYPVPVLVDSPTYVVEEDKKLPGSSMNIAFILVAIAALAFLFMRKNK